jgi:hypothetical protein
MWSHHWDDRTSDRLTQGTGVRLTYHRPEIYLAGAFGGDAADPLFLRRKES